jgi:hypothetical protein
MQRQRGRKSAASMSVTTPITAIPRPKPPAADALSPDELAEWRGITNRLGPDHFPRETHALLAAYCRHVTAGRRIADMIRTLEIALTEEMKEGLTAVEVVSSRAKIMDRLLGMHDREVRAASSLATRLRLTPQARKRPEHTPSSFLPRPWEV